MAAQDFATLGPGDPAGLLRQVEKIVVEAHRRSHEAKGTPWTEPDAYRWLHYEDPDPVSRLLEGAKRLRRRGTRFDADAVDNACAQAREMGFSN